MGVKLKRGSLHERVRKALITARQNGYSFTGWSDGDVAMDLNRYAAEFNHTPHDELVAAVGACRTGVFPSAEKQ